VHIDRKPFTVMSSAANLYSSVIQDVITNVRDSFLDESVDEAVLQVSLFLIPATTFFFIHLLEVTACTEHNSLSYL
jgi:hypothetical protein